MRITRREWLMVAGSFVSGALPGESNFGASHHKRRARGRKKLRRRAVKGVRAHNSARASDAGPLSGAKLFEDVITYYNLGEHRTATEADIKTSQWLADQLRGAGLATTFQSFSLRQFFVQQASLTIGSRRIRAFPLWFPRATEKGPVNASLALIDKNNARAMSEEIALVKFPFDPRATVTATRTDGIDSAVKTKEAIEAGRVGPTHSEVINAAAKAGARAVVAITEGPTGEIIALNSREGAQPWPIPVALAGPRDEPALMAAARSGVAASLLIDGDDRREARAKNVIGRVHRGKELIVVSTPQSGWFRCAAERGPGIAMFLGLARWASRRPSGSSFLFVSTSGHELGGLGMKAFLKELAPSSDRVLCWLHLGAGIAAFAWEETATGWKRLREPDSRRSLMTSPDLVPILTSSFADLPELTPTVGRAVGEFEFISKAGYRTFGIAAAHRFHHTPADSPEMTGPEILEPIGSALVRTIETIESR
ncbi:MAG TPA: hypothetical protein VGL29_01590 [Blastocatellia bacterium]